MLNDSYDKLLELKKDFEKYDKRPGLKREIN